MKKWIIILTIMLATIPTVLSCKPLYSPAENVIINDNIEEYGKGANCNISIFKGLVLNQTGNMTMNGTAYEYNATKLSRGVYSSTILCKLNNTLFMGECKFEVEEKSKMALAAIIGLPMLLAFIMLIGAATLSEHHNVLKIFLFLLSFIPFFTSLHFGLVTVIKFYDFPELQDAIGSATYYIAIMFGVIITYFIIYLVYMMIHAAAQKREAKLEY